MSLRFRDHQRFQWDTMAIVAAGSGIGTLAWAWPLAGAGWWMATGVGPLLAGLAGRSAHLPPRRSLLLVAVAAVAGAALAGTTWHGLASPTATLAVGEALLVGCLSGLAASLALALVHVERVRARPLVGALSRARASLSGDELALAERAVAAHDRIAGDLGSGTDADGRRLAHMAEDVTLKVLGLATRCRSLRWELERIDVDAVRRRAQMLADAAADTGDEGARADLTRASRAVVALDERVSALAGATTRVRARLELQVAMLEGTALAVAARQATAVVGEADALAPLADRLHEVGTDLHDQAQALAEASLPAR
jgi:hypothetical protein